MAIIKCTCNDEFMDATYGKGMRVATPTMKSTNRCCKCGKESSAVRDDSKKKGDKKK